MRNFIVITGPSGVGKGSLVNKLLESNDQIWLSISATTRAPREGEINGKDYFFLKTSQFEDLISEGGFVEWAEFAGNLYGTPRAEISRKLDEGKKVLLEIELEGARQVRKSFPDSFHIFIAPPSLEELERRIRGRGTESEEAIKKRLERAQKELLALKEFDEVVINEDLDIALSKIIDIIKL